MAARRFALAVALFFWSMASASGAADWVDYSPENFATAQDAERTILVDVTASWCPTCRAQHPILEELAGEDRLKDVLFVRVDFDTHKAFLREHRIPRQSTIVVFRGRSEVDRSVAETNRDRLRAFVFASLAQQ